MRFKPQRHSDEEVEKARKLLYDDRCSFAEASEKTGIPENTLKTISSRKGWPPLKRARGDRHPDPIHARRTLYDPGPPLKNTDGEIEWLRLHRRRDAEFSALVIREAVRIGLLEASK
jgi:hypothetical protein